MNPTSEDIKDLLVEQSSLGLTFKTNLFVGREPDHPNDVVTIFDTPGFGPMLTMTKESRYFYDSIQIRVRSEDYLTGYELALSILDFLHGKSHEEVNETYYSLIQCVNGPALLDWDKNNRARFFINFNVQRR